VGLAVRRGGSPLHLPHQIERERANATLDWGKRLVFAARLEPGMNRWNNNLVRALRTKKGAA
jgi:hypothetical protein